METHIGDIMKHAIVNSDNVVVNMVIWEGEEWLPPRDHIVVRSDEAGIGDIYHPETNTFSRPEPQPTE